jgi:hypothetical protein
MRTPRLLRGVLVVGATAALAGSLLASPAAARPSDSVDLPGLCNASFNVASARGYDVSKVASQRVVIYDGVKVRLTPDGWAASKSKDPSWALWFHSLNWLVPLALDDPKTAIEVFLERDAALPDPGSATSNKARKPYGWTQGQFRTRLETATCLYTLTRDKRLIPIAKRLVGANMDPERYPGPPRGPVHNHGTMSNIALVQAGRAFDMEQWIDYAVGRFSRDLPEVFSDCGMMWEQSSTYQEHNVSLWNRAARVLSVSLEEPEFALGALVRPDGVLEAIGDGQPEPGMTPNGGTLWCSDTGWAAGSPDASTHYTVHFGPETARHGHRDHGSITWYAYDVPVLSDRGLYDKKRDRRFDFAKSMAAHSVFEPVGYVDYKATTKGKRGKGTSFTLTDSADGISRQRRISISADTLVVRDRGRGAKEWIQHWQLAPGWTPTATGAEHSSGATLTIDCPRLKAVSVETFTAWRTSEDAWDLQCRVSARDKKASISTTLTVTPPL